MKQYVYRPEECGLAKWPEGELRLEGIEKTDDASQAAVFVYPGGLHGVPAAALDRLPYMKGNEDRHVFLHVSDEETMYHRPCLFIRCNTRPWYFATDPNTISFAWPVEDYAECTEVPEGGFKYDVGFQGWISDAPVSGARDGHLARRQSAKACLASSLKSDIAQYRDFCGYIFDQPEGIRRRSEFRRSMRESRVMLCGESIPGVFPYRFFEAMSAGRVPLLIGTDQVFPFKDEIPYEQFSISLPAHQSGNAALYIREFLATHSDDVLVSMGNCARSYWLKYLNSADWPRTMAYAVRKKLIAIENLQETAVL